MGIYTDFIKYYSLLRYMKSLLQNKNVVDCIIIANLRMSKSQICIIFARILNSPPECLVQCKMAIHGICLYELRYTNKIPCENFM